MHCAAKSGHVMLFNGFFLKKFSTCAPSEEGVRGAFSTKHESKSGLGKKNWVVASHSYVTLSVTRLASLAHLPLVVELHVVPQLQQQRASQHAAVFVVNNALLAAEDVALGESLGRLLVQNVLVVKRVHRAAELPERGRYTGEKCFELVEELPDCQYLSKAVA